MPERANQFHERLTKVAGTSGHKYHNSTNARVAEAKQFHSLLVRYNRGDALWSLPRFVILDMLIFGFVNSLRSSLGSFAHELVEFYGGVPSNPKNIDFTNLLSPKKVSLSLPPALHAHVSAFQLHQAFVYVNDLRNAMQHRHMAIDHQSHSDLAIGITTVAEGDADSSPSDASSTSRPFDHVGSGACDTPVSLTPLVFLPDDPSVSLGCETYSKSLINTAKFGEFYDAVHSFLLTSYDLAR